MDNFLEGESLELESVRLICDENRRKVPPELDSFGDDPKAGLGVPLGLLRAEVDILEGGRGRPMRELEIFSRCTELGLLRPEFGAFCLGGNAGAPDPTVNSPRISWTSRLVLDVSLASKGSFLNRLAVKSVGSASVLSGSSAVVAAAAAGGSMGSIG